MIPVRNIYYMLSYAFQILNENGYSDIKTENFNNAAELFSAILSKGISVQLKRGLDKNYMEMSESLSAIKGKINVSDSLKTQSIVKSQLVCSYDEFSENSYFNRILKTTVFLLLRADISKARKKELKSLMMFFSGVDLLDIHTIDWHIRYNKNNRSYHLLLSICNLVIKGLLQTQADGSTKLMTFLDEQRECRLYEKFILQYYRKHFPTLSVNPEQIAWQLDDEEHDLLPTMQSDIMLRKDNHILIIDAKYYLHNTQEQYGTHTLHSANLYQIFTYVKNKEYELRNEEHKVSGMLLYAKTDENVQPSNSYLMSGNKISVQTLDLNLPFEALSRQLDEFMKDEFNLQKCP